MNSLPALNRLILRGLAGLMLGISASLAAPAGGQVKKPAKPSASPASSARFESLAKQATAAREANNTDQAFELYQEALQLNPQWSEGWWYLGGAYYDKDQYAEAAKAFHILVELTPDYGAAWGFLGLCEFELKDYKNALIHIQRGRVLGLGDNQNFINVVRYHQALIEILSGGFEDAQKLLFSLVRQNVLSNDVKLALGLALLRVPLLPKQIDPSKDALISAAGHIGELEALGNFDPAKAAFEQLVRDYPTTPFVHYAYGAMLADLSHYPEAERELKEEIKINGESAMPYMQLAYVYIRLDQYQEALPMARKAAQLTPDFFAAHYLLGRALLGLGQVNESVKELQTAKNLGPFSPEVRYNLARALARAKRPREAAAEQAEFERLSTMRAKQSVRANTYRQSNERGELGAQQVEPPSGGGPPQ